MTRKEWKEKLAELLDSEPQIRDKQKFKKELIGYLNMLDDKADNYYGVRHEIIIAIENHLEL